MFFKKDTFSSEDYRRDLYLLFFTSFFGPELAKKTHMLKTSNNNGGKRVIRLSVRSLHVKKNVGEISFTGQEIFNLADLKRKEATLNFHINCGCKGGVRHYFTYF